MVYPKGKRDWPTYLHWWASGDEFPTWVPAWVLNRWPVECLNRLICRIWGHDPEREMDGTYDHCLWHRRRLTPFDRLRRP